MPNRNIKDIRNRWKSITQKEVHSRFLVHQTAQRKWQRWSIAEDEQLKHLVAKHGSEEWVAIATCMQVRDRKQGRARWERHFGPEGPVRRPTYAQEYAKEAS